jgi:hypothetical protein
VYKFTASLALALLLAALPAGATPEDAPREQVAPLERIRELVEVRLGSEPLPQQVDMLGRRSHAEVVLTVPLSGGLRLRGGTRVQLHEQPAANRSDVEAQPVVGIQLRF